MTAAFIYVLIAGGIIVIVALLLRPSREGGSTGAEIRAEHVRRLSDGPALSAAERIFDPADYLWLRDELGFPSLAESLRRNRQRLALKWLKAVRRSFNEIVRTPEPLSPDGTARGTQEGWQLLRLTLRFHLLLSYAFLVVRFFGPYHRLIPSLRWTQWPASAHPQGEPYGAPNVKHSL
jgi:hypothetical protein